jgi:hypothetical protein
MYGTSQGGFVTRIMEAWQVADPSNKQLIKKTVIEVLERMGVWKEYKGLLRTNNLARKMSREYLAKFK